MPLFGCRKFSGSAVNNHVYWLSSAADCFFQVIVPLSRLSRPRVNAGSCAPDRMQPDTRKSTRRLAAQTRERCAQFRIGNIPGHGFRALRTTRGDGLCTLHDLLASTEVVWCGAHLKTNQLLEKRLGAQCPYQGFV